MQNAGVQAAPGLEKRIKEFRTKFPSEGNQEVAMMICDWLVERLPEYQTLSYDEDRSLKRRNGCCGQARHDHLPNRRRHSGGSGSAIGDEQLFFCEKNGAMIEQIAGRIEQHVLLPMPE